MRIEVEKKKQKQSKRQHACSASHAYSPPSTSPPLFHSLQLSHSTTTAPVPPDLPPRSLRLVRPSIQRGNSKSVPLSMSLTITRRNLHADRDIKTMITAETCSSKAAGSRVRSPCIFFAGVECVAGVIVLRRWG